MGFVQCHSTFARARFVAIVRVALDSQAAPFAWRLPHWFGNLEPTRTPMPLSRPLSQSPQRRVA